MNVQLLNKVKKAIKNEPAKFSMKSWGHKKTCFTTHCIGGWAAVLSGKYGPKDDPEIVAQEQLSLSATEANRLFFVDEWPAEFKSLYGGECQGHPLVEKNHAYRAQVAIARINHFIKTNGEE